MSRFNKPIRLARLQTFPTEANLAHLSREAEKKANQAFEMIWPVHPESPIDRFVLTCTILEQQRDLMARSRGLADKQPPTWTLRCDLEAGSRSLWSHTTSDLSLIMTMIAAIDQTPFESESPATFNVLQEDVNLRDIRNHQSQTLQLPRDNSVGSPGPAPQIGNAGQIVLEGDVQTMELPSLFQSIMICKMTGRLNFYKEATQAEVYFEQGNLTHATIENTLSGSDSGIKCEQVVLELLTWSSGSFRFNPGWTTTQRTITRRLDGLLLEGATLVDYLKWLESRGFTPECQLKRDRLPDANTEDQLRQGAPVEMQIQKEMYGRIKEKTGVAHTIGELTSVQWIPALYNLMNVGLVSVIQSIKRTDSSVQSVTVNQDLVHNAGRSLTRPDSGIITYPLFLHFLTIEFARARAQKLPLSLVLFDLQCESGVHKENLETLSRNFAAIAQPYELLAHNENFDSVQYALLLPGRSPQSTQELLERFAAALHGDLPAMRFFFGIASAPADARDVDSLLTAATHAKRKAVSLNQTIFCFGAADLSERSATAGGGIAI